MTEEQAKKLAPGSAVKVEGTGKTVDGTVLSLAAADESGMVAVRAPPWRGAAP